MHFTEQIWQAALNHCYCFSYLLENHEKKRFYVFFARIGWFLIGKCCSLHIGDGQETRKITLLREETLEKFKFMLALHKQHNLKYKNVVLQKCSITSCS